MHLHCLTPCIEGCKQRGPLRHPFKTAPCIAEYSGAVGGQGFPISRHLPVLHHVHHTGVLRQPSLRRGGSSVLNPKREQIVDPVLCYMTWLPLDYSIRPYGLGEPYWGRIWTPKGGNKINQRSNLDCIVDAFPRLRGRFQT